MAVTGSIWLLQPSHITCLLDPYVMLQDPYGCYQDLYGCYGIYMAVERGLRSDLPRMVNHITP